MAGPGGSDDTLTGFPIAELPNVFRADAGRLGRVRRQRRGSSARSK